MIFSKTKMNVIWHLQFLLKSSPHCHMSHTTHHFNLERVNWHVVFPSHISNSKSCISINVHFYFFPSKFLARVECQKLYQKHMPLASTRILTGRAQKSSPCFRNLYLLARQSPTELFAKWTPLGYRTEGGICDMCQKVVGGRESLGMGGFSWPPWCGRGNLGHADLGHAKSM